MKIEPQITQISQIWISANPPDPRHPRSIFRLEAMTYIQQYYVGESQRRGACTSKPHYPTTTLCA